MSAERDGTLDNENYFVYDPNWSTLLGMEESFASHQQLNDHHFHYGYFIRAAAEVCRVDKAFCGPDQYGQMFELLIRDYAGGKDDPMFPYLRNFDPANGFSWASGHANFARGNNNESTSEAANAYGAMVLYGLVTGNDDIMERGMYLHASTSATYWEYWNDIDGWRGGDAEARNFPPGYPRITTSIIWGDGSAFSTWFSPAFAHILGIQGLPSNPLIMHVGLYGDYLDDYVTLGLEESPNGKPSGLPNGQWTDLWWNLWSMTDADKAIADYEATSGYEAEAGEAPAHTYHWIYTMRALGELQTGTGALTADYPAAMAFETDAGLTNYVVYNYSDESITVTFSDGTVVVADPNAFALEQM
jgi:endoglucanase Acf2